MKKNFIGTLVLFVIMGGLVAWYTLYEKKIRLQKNETEEKHKLITSYEKNDIQEVSITKLKNFIEDNLKPPFEFETFELGHVHRKHDGRFFDADLAFPDHGVSGVHAGFGEKNIRKERRLKSVQRLHARPDDLGRFKRFFPRVLNIHPALPFH